MSPRLAGFIVAIGAYTSPAAALTFARATSIDGETVVAADGPIVSGDAARLENFLDWLPSRNLPVAIAMNSPGGSVIEAGDLAQIIQDRGIPVAVLGAHTCASACFLIFAAAPSRIVGPNALVGVHSASINGQENMASMAITTLMARVAKKLRVPAAVIGKMVATTPADMAWLSVSELRAMGAALVEEDRGRKLLAAIGGQDIARRSEPPAASRPVLPDAPTSRHSGLQQRANRFIQDYFSTWSADNETANAFINQAYAPTVDFYGKPVLRSVIISAKQAYTVRWPLRRYQARAPLSEVECDARSGVCSISGTVDWDCRSPQRNARSFGAATFSLRVDLSSNSGTIVAEDGIVISRVSGN